MLDNLVDNKTEKRKHDSHELFLKQKEKYGNSNYL